MTINEKMQEISEDFDMLEGLQKMEYLVDLAKKSSGLEDAQKNQTSRISGCMSETWVLVEGNADQVYIKTDSEAQIVKGMLYLLEEAVNGHSKEEIIAIDEQNALNQLGIGGSITNRRSNGFANAILKIKQDVKKL
ncbi:MAG: SufE family protein [Calditrichae bacterium]|nr:SufE family protein [Calditrichia bacterium]